MFFSLIRSIWELGYVGSGSWSGLGLTCLRAWRVFRLVILFYFCSWTFLGLRLGEVRQICFSYRSFFFFVFLSVCM